MMQVHCKQLHLTPACSTALHWSLHTLHMLGAVNVDMASITVPWHCASRYDGSRCHTLTVTHWLALPASCRLLTIAVDTAAFIRGTLQWVETAVRACPALRAGVGCYCLLALHARCCTHFYCCSNLLLLWYLVNSTFCCYCATL
jgi:hypothetical protein